MCSECYQTPCASRCPNAPEPPVYGHCDKCDEPIRDGEDFWGHKDSDTLCESCVDNLSARELLEYFGYKPFTAEVAA